MRVGFGGENRMLTVIILWIIFTCQLALAFTVERRTNSPFLFIWPVVFVFVGLPIGLETFGALSLHSDTELFYGLAIGIIFNVFYLLGYSVLIASNSNKSSADVTQPLFQNSKQFITVALSVIVVIFIILYANGIGLQAILASTWRTKADLGFQAVLLSWLTSLLAGFFFYALDKKYRVVAITIFATFLIVLAFYRTRGILGSYLIAGFIFWILHKRRSVTGVVVFSVVGIFAAFFIRSVRFLGSLSNFTNTHEVWHILKFQTSNAFTTGDLSVYRIYLEAVKDCGTTLDCFNFTYLGSLARIFGLEASDKQRIEYSLFDQIVQEGVGGSLHPTVYGVIYADFGLFSGCLVFAFFGALHAFVKNFFWSEKMIFLLGFLGNYTIFFARGSVYNGLASLVIGVLFSFCLLLILRIRIFRFRNA